MRKVLIITILFVVFAFFCGGLYIHNLALKNNFRAERGHPTYIFIGENDTFDSVLRQCIERNLVINSTSFERWARLKHCETALKSGCYAVEHGMNNRQMVNRLMSGQQAPIQLTFNNVRLPEQLAARLGRQLMHDSAYWMDRFNDAAFLANYGTSRTMLLAFFVPNTYEVYWNVGDTTLFARMKREHERFWTAQRRAEADAIGLTPDEVVTLAAIVEEETNSVREKPIVARLYMNRLQCGMRLQSDPTVKYAVGDFTLTQVLNSHLQTLSPYNTYLHTGLPPGPIRMASIESVDAVLHADQNDYLYMCARPELDGTHNFTASAAEHARNAKLYHKALRHWQQQQSQIHY